MPVEVLESVDNEVINANQQYQAAQRSLEEFVANNQVKILQRLIDEKRGIINSLQVGKQTAVDTIVSEELKARSDVIAAYIQVLSANRLLAFTKEQEGKQALIGAYIDAEVENRLQIVEKDREVRETIFHHLTDAQLASTTAAFDQQVQSRIDQLRDLYVQKNRLHILLGQAQLLQDQIMEGGEAARTSNALALALLKVQMMIVPDVMPSDKLFQQEAEPQRLIVEQPTPVATQSDVANVPLAQPPVVSAPMINIQSAVPQLHNQVQINVDIMTASAASPDGQNQDITSLIRSLEEGLLQLEKRIETQAQALLSGDNYQLLDQMMASRLGVSGSISETLVALSNESDSINARNLSQQIIQRYLDLFDVGGLAASAEIMSADSALFTRISELYPDLFTPGDLSELAEDISPDNPAGCAQRDKGTRTTTITRARGYSFLYCCCRTIDPGH